MIRPELRARAVRHREMLVGGALCALGAWWLFGPGGLLLLPALALLVAGAALIWLGLQRARFRTDGAGAGVVQVTEGQITYLGPENGGAISLLELGRLTLEAPAAQAQWRLEQPGQAPLVIPVDAVGADALLDAFATLPGFQTARMLDVLNSGAPETAVIWQRRPRSSVQLPLH